MSDAAESTAARSPAARPNAFFLQAPGRRLGPLTREELIGLFAAGLVDREAMLVGPEWDGAFTASAAAEWLGVELRVPGRPGAAAGVAASAPAARLEYRSAGPGWRVVMLWVFGLVAVQMAIVPAQSLGPQPGLAVFLGAVAWRFALVAAACLVIAGGVHRLAHGVWPSARWPLAAMTFAYALLAVQFASQPRLPAVAPVAVQAPAPASDAAIAEALHIDVPTPAEADLWQDRQAPGSDVHDDIAHAQVSAPPVEATAGAPAAAPRAARIDPDPWWTKASALYNARDWNGLLAHSTAWTEALPDSKRAWLYLGLAHDRLGHLADALAANRRAHEIDPGDVQVASNLGNTLLVTGEYREAASLFEGILDREPDRVQTLNDYGYAMSKLGEYDEAVVALERAVKIRPSYSLAWQNLVNAYGRAGYLDKARETAERANARR